MKLLLISCLLALGGAWAASDDDYCFGNDKDRTQTRHFTSKTAYQIIKSTNIDKQYLVPGCTPKKIWIFHRHGTRLPSKSTIEKATRLEELRDAIVNNYQVLKTAPSTNALCNVDLLSLKVWKWNSSITPDMENYLTSQGYEDLRGTARTYQKYFPDVLPKQFNTSYYKFRHTDTQRTLESFKAFTEGLFGSNNDAVADPLPEKDYLLRPYDYCESFKAQNYNGKGSQCDLYRKSALWNQTIADVSSRLGFKYVLNSKDVELMYDICRYEQAWQVDRTSVWCAAFTPEQVTVFEYEDDMKYYYKLGYGFDANTRLNCRVVQDMHEHLSSNVSPHVVVNVGHSSGLQTLIAALGVSKDNVALMANNYQNLTDRKWRTSNIDPFASNFLAVKYQCDNDQEDKEKAVFFLNQNAVDLEWCQVGLCSWSEFTRRYSTLLNANCDSYYCADGATAVSVSLFSLLLAALVYLINGM